MKHFISYLFVLIFILNAHLKAQEETLETKILDLTKTIEKNIRTKQKITLELQSFLMNMVKKMLYANILQKKLIII